MSEEKALFRKTIRAVEWLVLQPECEESQHILGLLAAMIAELESRGASN